jgi:catechol 2,3-dioxygenase-like lactoylglutathione lyase family enzyme
MKEKHNLDRIDHVAIVVDDIDKAIRWYQSHFNTALLYADNTWAMLAFENTKLALVKKEQHPPHFAVECQNADQYGPLTRHRDGTESIYIKDSVGNDIELLRRYVGKI